MTPQGYRLIAFWAFVGDGEARSGEAAKLKVNVAAVIGWDIVDDSESAIPIVADLGSGVIERLDGFDRKTLSGDYIIGYTTATEGDLRFNAARSDAEDCFFIRAKKWATEGKNV